MKKWTISWIVMSLIALFCIETGKAQTAYFSVQNYSFSDAMTWDDYVEILYQQNKKSGFLGDTSESLNIILGPIEGILSTVFLFGSPDPFASRLVALLGMLDSAGRFLTWMQCGLLGIDDYLLYMVYNLDKGIRILFGPVWNFLQDFKRTILKLKDEGASESKIARVVVGKIWRSRDLLLDELENQYNRIKSEVLTSE